MQVVVHSGAKINGTEALELLKLVAMADQMPELSQTALISEWQMLERNVRSIYQGVLPRPTKEGRVDQAMTAAVFEILRDITFDPVDTVNQLTAYFEQQRDRLAQSANGHTATEVRADEPCAWMGNWNLLCRAYQRNPVGRVLTSVAMVDHSAYGNRIADLRNLAAATRLTIETRRQGLQGEALARFVAQAPENMCDIFSKAPFAYDPRQRQLTIQLREESTVLGEDRYTLSL